MLNTAKHSKKSAAFTAISTNLLSKIIGNIVAFLTSIIVIRLLSVEDFGVFSLFLGFLSIFGGLSFGIHHVYQRYVASYTENKSDMPRVIKLTIVMTILRLLIFFGILLIIHLLNRFGIFETSRFNFPDICLAVIVCVFVICKLMIEEGLISAYLDQKFFNMFDSSVTIMKALSVVIFMPKTVAGFIYIWLGFEIVRVAVLFSRLFFLIRKDMLKTEKFDNNPLEYKRYFDYGKYFFWASVSSQILAFDIDQYFLSYFGSSKDVGLYSFATKIAFALVGFAPANILFNVITPMIIKDYEQHKDKNRLIHAINTLFKLNLSTYSVMAVFLCINLSFIIKTVFQNKYSEAMPYIFAFIGVSFLPVIKNTFEPVARGIEKTKVYFMSVVSAVVNIIGNIALIPLLGMTGAVISTGVAISLQSIAFIVFARNEIAFSFDMHFLFRLIINIMPVALGGYWLQPYINQSVSAAVIINFLLMAAIFVLFKINRCFIEKESDFINSFLPGKLFVF